MSGFFRVILVSVAVLLAACSSVPKGPVFSERMAINSQKALVYFYRPDVYYGKAITYPILLNGEKIADMGNNSFFVAEIEPGVHSFQPDTLSVDHDLSVRLIAGETTYLRLTTGDQPPICLCVTLEFQQVDSETALREMASTRQEIERVYINQL